MKYDRKGIMLRAWRNFRNAQNTASRVSAAPPHPQAAGRAGRVQNGHDCSKGGLSFAEALHRAWLSAKAEPINAARIAAAKATAGIAEAVNTWAEWRKQGFEVAHGSKALFGVDLIWGSKGDGASYKARFFGESQVRPIAEGGAA